MHLDLGPDVDAPRRLVQDEDCGSVASHLAMTTFCWLPPDSAFAAWSTPVIRIRSRSAYPWASVRSTEPRISRLGKSRDRIGSVTLEAIGKSSTRPCW